ncbi:STAS domain-containing protein [Streptosporangium sp. NPDC051022]|uniref:STAS domain-containing protein n=1 Tax=Streptosporangium sp. NPDC051022 TaxID=3155752 RepID=UPI00342D34F3
MAIRLERRTDPDGSRVLVPIGDLDREAADRLTEAVEDDLAHSPGVLVISLTHVSFCDSSGIVTLLEAHAGAKRRDTELVLADVDGHLRNLFRLCALDQVIRIVEESHD